MKLKKIIQDINEYNEKLYNSYKPTDKIDFSKFKQNWGINVIPKEYHISLENKYKTKGGRVVELHEIKLFDENNNEYTYPVKGCILIEKNGKIKRKYSIWSIDGRDNVSFPNENNQLIKVEKQ